MSNNKVALALIGGGHANLEVLRRLAENPIIDLEVALYEPTPSAWSAMMVPGVIAGHYTPAQSRINLWALWSEAESARRPLRPPAG